MISLDVMIKTAAKKLTSYLKENNGRVEISVSEAQDFLKEKNIPLTVTIVGGTVRIEIKQWVTFA